MTMSSIFRKVLLAGSGSLFMIILAVSLAFPAFAAADAGREEIAADKAGEEKSEEKAQKEIYLDTVNQDDAVEEFDNSDIKEEITELKSPSMYFTRKQFEINKKKKKYLPLVKKDFPERSLILWKSSNQKVASVNRYGQVTAKKVGRAKITATLKGTSLSRTCTVDVVHTKTFQVRATGYCNCARCSGPGHPRTASGRYPKQGRTLAVDRRKIPLGSKIIMKGKTYYAEDVGGAIKGNRIDVYFRSHSQAQSFGVKRVKIKVYYKK